MNFRARLIALVSIIVLTLASIVSLFLIQEHTRYKRELIQSSQESLSTAIQSFQRNLDKHYSNRLKTFVQVHPLIVKAFSSRDRIKLQEETSNNFNKGTIRVGFPYN
jgi:capsular polysaccharide biosynthesis protein